MARLSAFGLILLVGLLAIRVNAVSLNCTALLYIKTNYVGEYLKMSLAPSGESDKDVILDLDDLPKPTTYRNWDDALNSAKLFCNCTAASAVACAANYDKVKLRVFAEPYWRKNGGGDFFDVNCTSAAAPAPAGSSCVGLLPAMPPRWGSRASALALLYNLPGYSLPTKKAPVPPSSNSTNSTSAPSPSSSPSPARSPSPSPSPSPSSSPSPARSPSPSPSPTPSPSPSPSPSRAPAPSVKSSPPPKAKSRPPPKAKPASPPKVKPSPKKQSPAPAPRPSPKK